MSDTDLVALLRWALPRLGLRWEGFRTFRGTVRKRLARRMNELGIADIPAYRARLDVDASEWVVFDGMCRIPISRLYRDHAVYERLGREILPARARAAAAAGRTTVRVWSAGCASGEEPYTVAIVWWLEVGPGAPGVDLELLATDVDATMLARAERGSYDEGSLRELPPELRAQALLRDDGGGWRVREELRRGITFRRQDMRTTLPDGWFDVILCRNSAFTYLDEPVQRTLVERIVERLYVGGVLVIGSHERLPGSVAHLAQLAPCIYERGVTGA